MVNRTGLTQNYTHSTGTILNDFENPTEWTFIGDGTATEDPQNILYAPTQGVRLTATTNAADLSYTSTINQDWSGVDELVVYFYLHTPILSVSAITIWVSSYTNLSKSIYKSIVDPYTLQVGWNKFIILRSDWNVETGESLDNTMVKIRLRIKSAAAAKADITFDSVYINRKQKAQIVLEFDDNGPTPYSVGYPILKENNMVATWFVNPDRFGTGGYVELEDIHTLHDEGWTIANHTWDHTHLTTLTLPEQVEQIRSCRDFLIEEGFTRGAYHFAYPYGEYDDNSLIALERCGIKTGRVGGTTGHNYPEIYTPYLMKTTYSMSSSTTFETIKAVIDEAVAYGQSITILCHGISDSPSISTTCYTDVFTAMVEYLEGLGDAYLATIDEWYEGLINPRYRSVEPTRNGVSNRATATRT